MLRHMLIMQILWHAIIALISLSGLALTFENVSALFHLHWGHIARKTVFGIYTRRIHHECGGREKSVPRITVWHHEVCGVMTNSDPEGRIFISHRHTNNGFFFFLPPLNNLLGLYTLFYRSCHGVVDKPLAL